MPTELGQQVIERYQAGKSLTSQEAIDEYKEVAAAAGLLGGTVRGTGQTLFGQKPPPETDNKNSQLQQDQRLRGEQATQQEKNANKIISELNIKPEQQTVDKVAKSESDTKEILQAAKEIQSPYQPVKLSDLDPIDAQKIRIDRVNINRDVSPSDVEADTTMLEIETILGEKVALNQKAKQKTKSCFSNYKNIRQRTGKFRWCIRKHYGRKKKIKTNIKRCKNR